MVRGLELVATRNIARVEPSGRKLEHDVLLDTLEEPPTWTSEQNYLGGRNFSRFPFSQLAT